MYCKTNLLPPEPFDSQSITLGDTKFSNFCVTIHWKAVEQYFKVVLFVNRLTPRVKPLGDTKFPNFRFYGQNPKL